MFISGLLIVWNLILCYFIHNIQNNIETICDVIEILNK